MHVRITLKPLPVRVADAVDVAIEVLEDNYWFLEVTRDFWMSPGENLARASTFVITELARISPNADTRAA